MVESSSATATFTAPSNTTIRTAKEEEEETMTNDGSVTSSTANHHTTTPTTTTTSATTTTTTTTTTTINLFDYTEEELYCAHTNGHSNNNSNHSHHSNHSTTSTSHTNTTTRLKFNHYELLQIPIHATSYEIKKAYRKLSLRYHPDKTGRDENDYGTYHVLYGYSFVLYFVGASMMMMMTKMMMKMMSFPQSHSLKHLFLSLGSLFFSPVPTTTTLSSPKTNTPH